jgi:hypothetical protein
MIAALTADVKKLRWLSWHRHRIMRILGAHRTLRANNPNELTRNAQLHSRPNEVAAAIIASAQRIEQE